MESNVVYLSKTYGIGVLYAFSSLFSNANKIQTKSILFCITYRVQDNYVGIWSPLKCI